MGNIISKLCCCSFCESETTRREREIQFIYEKISPAINIHDNVISV